MTEVQLSNVPAIMGYMWSQGCADLRIMHVPAELGFGVGVGIRLSVVLRTIHVGVGFVVCRDVENVDYMLVLPLPEHYQDISMYTAFRGLTN